MAKQGSDVAKKYNIVTYKKLNVNYWAVPKSGNTSIKYALAVAVNPSLIGTLDKKFIAHHKCDYITPEQALSNNRLNFTVIREPTSRLISLYNTFVDRKVNGKNVLTGSKKFTNHSKQLPNNLTISQFISFLSEYDDNERNIHYKSQSFWGDREGMILLKLNNIKNTLPELISINSSDIQYINVTEKPFKNTLSEQDTQSCYRLFEKDYQLWEKAK